MKDNDFGIIAHPGFERLRTGGLNPGSDGNSPGACPPRLSRRRRPSRNRNSPARRNAPNPPPADGDGPPPTETRWPPGAW